MAPYSDARYVDPKPMSREEAADAVDSGDVDRVGAALVALSMYESDWVYVQDVCLRFLGSEVSDLRGLAATCLGHVARVHGKLDVDKVVPALAAFLDDPKISGRVEDALDDISMFATSS